MPVSIVFGGQFGSEGKGKVAYEMAKQKKALAMVRVGGPNAGHTAYEDGKKYVVKQIPTLGISRDLNTVCFIAPGSFINPEILFNEMNMLGLSPDRLIIDPNACIIQEKHIIEESGKDEDADDMHQRIGSTASGTGAALKHRTSRKDDVILAKDYSDLKAYVGPTVHLLREMLDKGERVFIEGTQGFGLSNIHSKDYPRCTSRDTSAAAFLMEAGLSIFDVDEIIMVIRTFPIRVAGNSGGLPDEISWGELSKEVGKDILEYTTVTKKIRRVGRFHPEVVKQAIEVNKPNIIVLNHIDYVDPSIAETGQLTGTAVDFLKDIYRSSGALVTHYGYDSTSVVEVPSDILNDVTK